ncbi:Retrotrans gag domain-containing protein [Abeliophyllum distichum]|uniref:Retrotrans gag domain-containing protein n=1 Tax=Abeliophyllum distichum TaxID=126358 RepID=A0ABD1SCR5_9LAMI
MDPCPDPHMSLLHENGGDYTTSEESLEPVMVAEMTPDSDDRFQQMALAIEKLTKSLEDKEAQISTLMHRLELQSPLTEDNLKNASSSRTKDPEIQEHQQNRRIEEMRMPLGYQPPKFQCFDGEGNPKQHVAHFIETCNKAGTYNDTMAKQFVRSLRGAAFEWYTDLPAGSIDSWDQLEREFLTRFYSTGRTVSLPELARTKQSKEELVEEYIERWRNLVLNCKERISEASSIDMCVQGMHWGLLYNLQANMPHSFEELATRAHDLEIQIARHGSYLPSDVRDKKYPKKKIKRDVKAGKPKEAMTIFTVPSKITFQKSGSNLGPKPKPELKPKKVQVQRKGLLTLKELEEKEYPFSDSGVYGILDQLLEQKIIELPAPKRPEEAGQVDHPKYCRFHQIISHQVERCFVLKDLIVRLDKENKIKLETGENPTASYSMVSFGSFYPILISNKEQTFFTPYDAGKSLSEVAEFGPQLLKGAIPVEFKVDEEVTITYVYPEMDEIGDGWSTFISKKEKYQRSNETGKKSSFEPLAGHTLEAWSTEVQSIEEVSSKESQEAWTLVKRRNQKAPQLPSPDTHDEKPRSRRKSRNNQRRKIKIKARANAKSTEMEATSRPFPRPVTLEQYFPKSFFNKQCFTSYVINVDEGSELKNVSGESSKTRRVISQLSNIPSGTSLADALNLSFDDRMALIAALIDLEAYQGKVLELIKSTTYQDCMATIMFNDDDLQLGSHLHNRSLYVSGYIRECKLHRIMIDYGSAVNIMPIKIMKKIGINVGDLSKSNIMIQ